MHMAVCICVLSNTLQLLMLQNCCHSHFTLFAPGLLHKDRCLQNVKAQRKAQHRENKGLAICMTVSSSPWMVGNKKNITVKMSDLRNVPEVPSKESGGFWRS